MALAQSLEDQPAAVPGTARCPFARGSQNYGSRLTLTLSLVIQDHGVLNHRQAGCPLNFSPCKQLAGAAHLTHGEQEREAAAREMLDDEELQRVYQWVDEIPLSRPKRSIARDFADGVLVAEIVCHYFPKMIELHNYSNANGYAQKIYNWCAHHREGVREPRAPVMTGSTHPPLPLCAAGARSTRRSSRSSASSCRRRRWTGCATARRRRWRDY